jgi:hypothetical protein
MVATDIWKYRDQSYVVGSGKLIGYEIEAIDGHLGKIDEEVADEDGASFLVVDTGPWIFGKKVMLPAGVISAVDGDREKVLVNRTKEQIKAAPELTPESVLDENYWEMVGTYYGPTGSGWHGL